MIKQKIKFRCAGIEEYEVLYEEFIIPYFHPDEVKPLDRIIRMYQDGRYQVFVLEDEGMVLAAAFLVLAPAADLYLLDYLAVRKDRRGEGLGSQMLSSLKEQVTNDHPIMIETEALLLSQDEIEYLERSRRNAFYRRNGAYSCGFYTWIYGATYEIWLLGDRIFDNNREISKKKVVHEQELIYRYMIPADLYETKCLIPFEATSSDYIKQKERGE